MRPVIFVCTSSSGSSPSSSHRLFLVFHFVFLRPTCSFVLWGSLLSLGWVCGAVFFCLVFLASLSLSLVNLSLIYSIVCLGRLLCSSWFLSSFSSCSSSPLAGRWRGLILLCFGILFVRIRVLLMREWLQVRFYAGAGHGASCKLRVLFDEKKHFHPPTALVKKHPLRHALKSQISGQTRNRKSCRFRRAGEGLGGRAQRPSQRARTV